MVCVYLSKTFKGQHGFGVTSTIQCCHTETIDHGTVNLQGNIPYIPAMIIRRLEDTPQQLSHCILGLLTLHSWSTVGGKGAGGKLNKESRSSAGPSPGDCSVVAT